MAAPPRKIARAHTLLHLQLESARAQHHSEAQRLGTVRSEAVSNQEEQLLARIQDLLARELDPALGLPPPQTTGGGGRPPLELERCARTALPQVIHGLDSGSMGTVAGGQGEPVAHSPPSAPKAETFISLVRRIELLVRGREPALALHVGGRIDGEVCVERTGPNEVGLTLRPKRPGSRERVLEELRAALQARGLKLSTLQEENSVPAGAAG